MKPVKNKQISITWFLFQSLQTYGKVDLIHYLIKKDTHDPTNNINIPTIIASIIKFILIIKKNYYYSYHIKYTNTIFITQAKYFFIKGLVFYFYFIFIKIL